MQANFEVRGWGPAPNQPLDADVLSTFSLTNPRDTVKWLKERQWAMEGQGEEPR